MNLKALVEEKQSELAKDIAKGSKVAVTATAVFSTVMKKVMQGSLQQLWGLINGL